VVVTRNPCFHPGDIRLLTAIDVPALHQLKNVIVFPMDGPRSHPAEMSGGDLDGDTFWVSHEQKLLFNENEEPFDYHDQATEDAKQIELEIGTVYTIDDVCNFFVEYIEADK
jgi:RNA-dependent RNA polymerase